MSSAELYGLRLFQLVQLARDLSEEIARTSDRVLASMFSPANAPSDLAGNMVRLATQTRQLQLVLTELRQRSDAWVTTHLVTG